MMRDAIHEIDRIATVAGEAHCRLSLLVEHLEPGQLRSAAESAAALLDRADELLTVATLEARGMSPNVVRVCCGQRPARLSDFSVTFGRQPFCRGVGTERTRRECGST